MSDLSALYVTLKLALITTLLLMLIGTPLAWWLAKMRSSWKVLWEAFIALPLILPPTVIGFYFLIAFAPDSALGKFWQLVTNQQLAFSFSALVIGSFFYSLPFVVQPLQKAFEQLGDNLLEASQVLGASKLDSFFSIVMPMTKASFITAASLGFAHTIGEFGIVLMIGGNIPGETRVLSVALFEHVESFNYTQAHLLAAWLLIGSFVFLALIALINKKSKLGKINVKKSANSQVKRAL